MDLSCDVSRIQAYIPISVLPGPQNITWRDPSCVVMTNGTHYTSTVPLTSCGTTMLFTNDSVKFQNELIVRAVKSLSAVIATDIPETVIPIECVYPRHETITTMYRPIERRVRFFERGIGHLDVEIDQVTDGTFQNKISRRDTPRSVNLNDKIFIKLSSHSLDNHTKLGLHVEKCFATKSPAPSSLPAVNLVENGCPAVSIVEMYFSPMDEVRMSVRSFEFVRETGGYVFIHCQVNICPTFDLSCVKGCNHGTRHRREASEHRKYHLLSSGPFQIDRKEDSYERHPIFVVGGVLVAAVGVTGFVYKRRQHH